MIENAGETELHKLFAARGKVSDCLLMRNFQEGALFHVTTKTGEIYLVEVEDTQAQRIHVARRAHDGEKRRVVYLGNHNLTSGKLKVGDVIHCKEMDTSPIALLAILSS